MTMNLRSRLLVLVAATCLLNACIPIPVKHSDQVTPTVVGTLSLDDDTPAAHYFIAVTDDLKDRTCSRPGGRGVTDSLGRFRVPETSAEKKTFWFTLMENLGMRVYWVCARPAALGAPDGTRVDESARTTVWGHFRGDSVDCLRWHWRDTTRLSCNATPADTQIHWRRAERQILRGGSWTVGDVSGSYRVLVVRVGRWESAARAVVQWVGRTPGTPNTVRAQMDLPMWDFVSAWGASLDHVGDAWRVRVESARKTRWGNDIWLTFELGTPGEIHEIREK